MREWDCAWGHRFPLVCAVRRPLVMILFPLLPLRRQRAMMAGHARVADGGHALAGKWLRRLMGAFLSLAPNPIDTRALATRALATAPESAGIGDMQGKATPGLEALGGGIAAAGQNAAVAKEAAKKKAEEDAAYAEHDAEEAQLRRSAEDRGKREAAEAARAANHHWGDPETLAGHYAEHGEGVGATSKEKYADMAHELYLNKGLCQASVDEEGITRVYDAARNPFGSYNPDGTTRTLFAPPEARPTSTIRDGPCREHAREET